MSRKKMSVKEPEISKQEGTVIVDSSAESLRLKTMEEEKTKFPNDTWVYDEPVR